MRKHLLDALLPKTRQTILAATVMNRRREWYLSDLARHLRVQPSSLQRELANLVAAGILRRRDDGNRVYYQADSDCPLFGDIYGMLMRTIGLRDVLAENLEPFAHRIQVAFVYGSVARAEEHSASDVDLMVIGRVGLADLAPGLRAAENRLARPVNATVYAPAEIAKKLASGHHFLQTIMSKEMLFVVGERMTWQQLQAANRVRTHQTSKQELDDIRTVIERDLRDAGIVGRARRAVCGDTLRVAITKGRLEKSNPNGRH